MTTSVGIIEWLNNTVPLKEIIEKQLTSPGKPKTEIGKIDAAQYHQQWLEKLGAKLANNSGSNNVSVLYHTMLRTATREMTVKKVEDQYQKVPPNLLQRGIWALAASPEAYLFIRNQFARSLATFSVCSYIIGTFPLLFLPFNYPVMIQFNSQVLEIAIWTTFFSIKPSKFFSLPISFLSLSSLLTPFIQWEIDRNRFRARFWNRHSIFTHSRINAVPSHTPIHSLPSTSRF